MEHTFHLFNRTNMRRDTERQPTSTANNEDIILNMLDYNTLPQAPKQN